MVSGWTPWMIGGGSIPLVTVLLALPKLLVISSLAGAYIAPIGAVSSSRSSPSLGGSGRHKKAAAQDPPMTRKQTDILDASPTRGSYGDDLFPDAITSEGDVLDDPQPAAPIDKDMVNVPSISSQKAKLVHVEEAQHSNMWNIPNILTIARVIAIPIFAAVFYAALPKRNVWCALIFAGAALTDWLDGFLARKLEVETPFGAFLDPVADKLMVSTALILLSERLGSWMTICSAIILCRELGISALREWMAQLGLRDTVKVGNAGKWKTATQMVAICLLLLLEPGAKSTLLPVSTFMPLAKGLLSVSTILTVTSGAGYLKAAWPALMGQARTKF